MCRYFHLSLVYDLDTTISYHFHLSNCKPIVHNTSLSVFTFAKQTKEEQTGQQKSDRDIEIGHFEKSNRIIFLKIMKLHTFNYKRKLEYNAKIL